MSSSAVTPAAPSRKRLPRTGCVRCGPDHRIGERERELAQLGHRVGSELVGEHDLLVVLEVDDVRAARAGDDRLAEAPDVLPRREGVDEVGPRPSGKTTPSRSASEKESTGNGGRPTSSTVSGFDGTAIAGETACAWSSFAIASTCSALLPVKSQWLTKRTFKGLCTVSAGGVAG